MTSMNECVCPALLHQPASLQVFIGQCSITEFMQRTHKHNEKHSNVTNGLMILCLFAALLSVQLN